MELYTWEYKGKQEWGFKDSTPYALKPNFATLYIGHDEKGEFHRRYAQEITNLRPAKVVDKDAVVIEINRADRLFLHEVPLQAWRQSGSVDRIHKQLIQQVPTPPVTEPKGFGAIVEAEVYDADSGIMKWVFDGQRWHSNGYTRSWQNLINPTILSEGLK